MYIILLVKIDDVLLRYIFLLIKIAVREVFYFDSFYKSEVKWQYAETGGNFFAGFGQHLTERRTEEKKLLGAKGQFSVPLAIAVRQEGGAGEIFPCRGKGQRP